MRVRVDRRLGAVLLLAALLAAAPRVQAAADEPPAPGTLTEIERLQIENLELKAAVRQLRAEAAAREAMLTEALLEHERHALEDRLRARLKPAADTVFDWKTRSFVPRPPAGDGGAK